MMVLVVTVMERFPSNVLDAKQRHAPQTLILEHPDLAWVVISVPKYFVATKRCEAYEKMACFLFRIISKYEACEMKCLAYVLSPYSV